MVGLGFGLFPFVKYSEVIKMMVVGIGTNNDCMLCSAETFDILQTTSGHTLVILHWNVDEVTIYDNVCNISYVWTAENFSKMGPYKYMGSLEPKMREYITENLNEGSD